MESVIIAKRDPFFFLFLFAHGYCLASKISLAIVQVDSWRICDTTGATAWLHQAAACSNFIKSAYLSALK